MAAKQGTLAQLSQAGEDAKRAVLSRTGVSASSWFSNLNTVCTIKSAPPRSPEVLQMLATKSGWLFKRNEQHVWQARWCCAVPHTFLYYFDANIVPSTAGGGPIMQQPSQKQQDAWNRAVAKGYGNRKQHEKRSNFYLFNNTTAENALPSSGNNNDGSPPPNTAVSYNNTGDGSSSHLLTGEAKEAEHTGNFSTNMQPAGIIDLECYTTIHRSSENPNILELAGDDQVNPDLRSFYFCATNPNEGEDWTDALLNGRHSALQDECEAYKQVCDGFAQQLQILHQNLDDAAKAQEEADAELYSVRSQMEELRRTVMHLAEECLERPIPLTGNTSFEEGKSDFDGSIASFEETPIQNKRVEFSGNLETIRSQDMGVPATVRLLTEYCACLENLATQQYYENTSLQQKLKRTGQSDQQRVQELTAELDTLKQQKETELNQYKQTVAALQEKYQQTQKELQDVQNELNSTRMEVTMYQSQQRSKLAELQQHKKILKKEVLDLRAAVEEKDSRIQKCQLQRETDLLAIEQEKAKTALLERYIDKMESQVQVQQNMMEMMSQTGGASVYGGGSVYGAPRPPSIIHHQHSPHKRNMVVVRKEEENLNSGGEDDNSVSGDEETEGMGDVAEHIMRPIDTSHNSSRSSRTPNRKNYSGGHRIPPIHRSPHHNHMIDQDVDNKSHVSELTEDRTQRQFEAFATYANNGSSLQYETVSRDFLSKKYTPASPRTGPPLHIIGVNKNQKSSGRVDERGEDVKSNRDNEDGQRRKSKQNKPNKNAGNGVLDTINSSSASSSLPPASNGPQSTTQIRREIPKSGGGNASVSSTGSKLSVAQRARMDADKKSTPVTARLDEKTQAEIEKPRGIAAALTPIRLDGNYSPAQEEVQSQSQSSGLWKRMENAVLGPGSEESYDSDEDGSSSLNSHPERDYDTSDKSNSNKLYSENSNKQIQVQEEKKTSEPSRPLTIQERAQMQREKQLNFLREQGLVKDESDIRGGAGAMSDNGSVSSSNISPTRSFLSFPGKLKAPSPNKT